MKARDDIGGMRMEGDLRTISLLRSGRGALGLVLGLLACLLLPGAAVANSTHPYLEGFGTGPGCQAEDVGVQEAEGILYVLCDKGFGPNEENQSSVRKFSLSGEELPFSASEPYVSGANITGTPDPLIEFTFSPDPYAFGNPLAMAIDNSNGPNRGDIFVANGYGSLGNTAVDIFAPSGKWIGSIPIQGSVRGIDIDGAGNIYLGVTGGENGIRKFDPAFHEVERIWTTEHGRYYEIGGDEWADVAVDNTGAVYGRRENNDGETYGAIYKFEKEAFSTNLNTGFKAEEPEEGNMPSSPYSPYSRQPLIPAEVAEETHGARAIDVDRTTNEFYADRQNRMEVYFGGDASEPLHQLGPAFGEGHLSKSKGVFVARNGTVYASTWNSSSEEFEVAVFGRGDQLPRAQTYTPRVPDIGHDTAILRGHVDPAGGGPVIECMLEWGPVGSPGYSKPPVPCIPEPSGGGFTEGEDVSAQLPAELTVGQEYRYRFSASNGEGYGWGAERKVSPVAVLDVEPRPATDITTNSATLNGVLNPDSMATTYHFEYGLSTEYHQRTPDADAGSGSSLTPLSVGVQRLLAGRTYHFRLVAENSQLGTTYGPDMTFVVGAKPKIGGLTATNLSDTGATLNARVNPAGYKTTYHFDYGTTSAYGQTIPVPDELVGEGYSSVLVSNVVSGLQPGVTYHFEVVATNRWGASKSDDTTFTFAPPVCPNSHIRQQTSANFLPDCRAYELVTPANAGTAQIFPTHEIHDFGGGVFAVQSEWERAEWEQNTGEATNPPRYFYYAGLGAVPGFNPPNSTIDSYLATRTTDGWVTTMPGYTGAEALAVGRHECSSDLSLCLDHKAGEYLNGELGWETAPALFDASGKKLGRLPTNVQVVPGGTKFLGDQQSTPDLSKFVFSSLHTAFAPGGLTESPGSVYLNDRRAHTIKIISRLAGGGDIPHGQAIGNPEEETIGIPPHGMSDDASHIVMATQAADGEKHLYLYAHGVTRPMAGEHPAEYAGMTKDGSSIYITSPEQLTNEDHDTSVDLYVWRDATEKLTLVSVGDGNGNSDECSASWAAKCSIEIIHPERGDRYSFYTPNVIQPEWNRFMGVPGIDSKLATEAGDIYYYSPEELDPNSPAAPGERNLYVYREGRNQFVATLDPGTSINRIQISPDGQHAGFITAANLTGYDSAGHKEMYTYEPSSGKIRCASCNPTGATPEFSVIGSQGGPFMSNDGRVFFATHEALVPRDTDRLIDVYEYVGGQPQLITTGTQTRDYNAAQSATVFFAPEHIGLESVSASGQDVYFTTFDTLVPQDLNGSFIKIYDARTGGGFEVPPPLAPCAAADECHGESTSSVQTPDLPSSTSLAGGNVTTPAKRVHRRRQGRHGRRHHRRHRHGRRRHQRSGGQRRG